MESFTAAVLWVAASGCHHPGSTLKAPQHLTSMAILHIRLRGLYATFAQIMEYVVQRLHGFAWY